MFSELKSALRPALVLTALFALLLGLVYPLALTAMGQLVFPEQANGSLVRDGSKIVGSKLIGQRFLAVVMMPPLPRGRTSVRRAKRSPIASPPTSRRSLQRHRAALSRPTW